MTSEETNIEEAVAASTKNESENPNQSKFRSSDEGPPPPARERCGTSTWRGDPAVNYSDWKIEVLTVHRQEGADDNDDNDDGTALTVDFVEDYHVHKFMLACGARKSEYFAKLFQNATNKNFHEAESCTSRLELDPLAAQAFPHLLDYVYEQDQPLQITTETATALHFLGEYLDIWDLRWSTKEFCKTDISMQNVDTYYNHAMIFMDEPILDAVAKFLGENILDISLDDTIVKTCAPRMWWNILDYTSKDSVISKHVTTLLAAAFEKDDNSPEALDLDLHTFRDMTDASKIPHIDPHAGLALCEVEDSLESDAMDARDDLSSFQKRCSDSLSAEWESMVDSPLLRSRKPSFLVDVLLKSLSAAKSELQETKQQLRATEQKFRSTQLQFCRAEESTRLAERNLLEADRQLEELRVIFKRFKPVSNDYLIEANAKVDIPAHLLKRLEGCRYTEACAYRGGVYCPMFYFS